MHLRYIKSSAVQAPKHIEENVATENNYCIKRERNILLIYSDIRMRFSSEDTCMIKETYQGVSRVLKVVGPSGL